MTRTRLPLRLRPWGWLTLARVAPFVGPKAGRAAPMCTGCAQSTVATWTLSGPAVVPASSRGGPADALRRRALARPVRGRCRLPAMSRRVAGGHRSFVCRTCGDVTYAPAHIAEDN